MKAAALHRGRAALLAGAVAIASGLACAEALPGSLPLRRDAEPVGDGGAWMPSLLLLGVAAAAGGYAWWRRGPGGRSAAPPRRGEAAMTRLSSQALTPHASVHAVRWNGEEFLLACTPQQVTLVARRPVPQDEGGTP